VGPRETAIDKNCEHLFTPNVILYLCSLTLVLGYDRICHTSPSRALLAPSRPPLNISPWGDHPDPFLMLRGPGGKAVGGGKRHPTTKVNLQYAPAAPNLACTETDSSVKSTHGFFFVPSTEVSAARSGALATELEEAPRAWLRKSISPCGLQRPASATANPFCTCTRASSAPA